jgi:hypothetical protein
MSRPAVSALKAYRRRKLIPSPRCQFDNHSGQF